MMEDDLKPMTEHDIVTPAKPIAEAEQPSGGKDATQSEPQKPALPMTVEQAKQQAKEGAANLSQQAGDKAVTFAEQGKGRAVDALEQLSKLIEEAAGQIDDKLGGGNGQYVRTAAGTVQGFADQLREKDVDDLVGEAKTLIGKSPGIAIGAAAAVGFVVARLVSAGIDQRDA